MFTIKQTDDATAQNNDHEMSILRRLLPPVLVLSLFAYCPVIASGQSLAEKLATIEEQGPPSEQTVKRFETLLSNLSTKYSQSNQEISDITVKGSQIMENKGLTMSLLDTMEGINRVTPPSGTDQSYRKVVATYVSLRAVESYSHEKSIAGLKAII